MLKDFASPALASEIRGLILEGISQWGGAAMQRLDRAFLGGAAASADFHKPTIFIPGLSDKP